MTKRKCLVVGGTGPTGVCIVERMLDHGCEVTIFHTGKHEIEFSQPVEHIHADPREETHLMQHLSGRTFDTAVSTSGRIRYVVRALSGRVRKLVAISGLPYYRKSHIAPGEVGIALPIRESDQAETDPAYRHGNLVVRGEETVMDAHARGAFDATILRYTMVYGRYSYVPFEWFLVRRILDRRQVIALESDGLMVPQRGFAGNLAEAVMLSIDNARASGQAYNVGDEQCLSLRALTALVAEALDHSWELVEVPLRFSPCRNPFAIRQNTLFDLSKIRTELGYRDVLPVREATVEFVRWLRDHPLQYGGTEELALGPTAFDYPREDRVIERFRNFYNELA
jgi:nucleoside-diphosphate-sugar epimerase